MAPERHLSRQDEFARHGFLEGYPLWNPAPVCLPKHRQADGLQIGDVGIVDEDGCFYILFNLHAPTDHGFPPGFTPIEEPVQIIDYKSFPPGHVFSAPETPWCSEDSEVEAPRWVGESSHTVTITQYTATLSKDSAHIVVPHGATYSELVPQDNCLFESLAHLHWSTWFRFASDQLGRPPSSLHLISRCCRAHSWAVASFDNKNDQEVLVSCELVEKNRKIQWNDSRWTPSGRFPGRIGPEGLGGQEYDTDNQTVFIQSFMITPNGHQAGPAGYCIGSSGGGTATTGTTSTCANSAVTIRRVPEIIRAPHPSEVINQYLLMKQPSAEAAVTHDSVWITMLERGQLSKLEDLGSALDAIVSKLYLIVLKNGVVCLRNKDVSLETTVY